MAIAPSCARATGFQSEALPKNVILQKVESLILNWGNMERTLKSINRGRIGKVSPSLNTGIFWSLIAIFSALDAIGLAAEGISVVPAPLWDMVWRIAVMVFLSLFYTYLRPDVRIATLMHAVAMFAATATPVSIFYYVALGWNQPLVDAHLAAADRALGLDWVSVYKWVIARPPVQLALSLAYYSLLPQTIVLIFALNFLGETGRCWEIPWLLLVAGIVAIPFAIFAPAVGTFGYYHMNEKEPYLPIIEGLHSGTLKTLDFKTMQGVVTFPSFHAASAIMLAYAARGTRFLFPLFVVLNALMFLATVPLEGTTLQTSGAELHWHLRRS
jgi:PAP2 superfamily